MFFTQNNVYMCVCNHWLKVANGFKATLDRISTVNVGHNIFSIKYRLRTRLQFGLLFWVLWVTEVTSSFVKFCSISLKTIICYVPTPSFLRYLTNRTNLYVRNRHTRNTDTNIVRHTGITDKLQTDF